MRPACIKTLLGQVPQFRGFSSASLDLLASMCWLRALDRKQRLDLASFDRLPLLIVAAGLVSVSDAKDAAQDYAPGAAIDADDFLNGRRSAKTVIALRPAQLVCLDYDDTIDLLTSDREGLLSRALIAALAPTSERGDDTRQVRHTVAIICDRIEPETAGQVAQLLEGNGDVRCLTSASYGNFYTAGNDHHDAETRHFLHENDLQFDYTVLMGDRGSEAFCEAAIADADRVILMSGGKHASPWLDGMTRFAQSKRGGDKCYRIQGLDELAAVLA